MNDDGLFVKKGQRKLTPFVGQELLYDHITGQLDADRKKAVDEYLTENREAQGDLQKIQNGMVYSSRLSETVISEALLEKVRTPSSYWQVLQQKIRFDEWPAGLKLGLEAMVVALGITSVAVLVPWHKVMEFRIGGDEVVLSEVNQGPNRDGLDVEVEAPGQELTFTDEGAQSPTPTPAVSQAESQKQKPTTTPTAPTTAATAATVVKENADTKRQGFLYRGAVSVTNVQAVSPKVAEKLIALGGRKAGEVELGWLRPNGSGYFHFTVPETKYNEVLALFNEFGILKVAKENHERMMPEGIIRLIVTMEEKQ